MSVTLNQEDIQELKDIQKTMQWILGKITRASAEEFSQSDNLVMAQNLAQSIFDMALILEEGSQIR